MNSILKSMFTSLALAKRSNGSSYCMGETGNQNGVEESKGEDLKASQSVLISLLRSPTQGRAIAVQQRMHTRKIHKNVKYGQAYST